MRRNRIYFLLFFLILLIPQNASTCGPFFPDAIFTYKLHPGKPLKWYADGKLGVVLPTFARSYLVVAYRYLSGRPLSAGESHDAVRYWRWALQSSWSDDQNKDLPEKEWLQARAEVVGARASQPTISMLEKVDAWDYQQIINCQIDAFHTATLTLKDRVKHFGAKSEEIREWIQGQDAVFSNCASNGSVPGMIAEGRPAVLKADRQYQIAAAEFYQRNFNAAEHQFDQIARDTNSPWHTIAPYLAARSVWREAVLVRGEYKPDMEKAYQRLRQILNDPEQRSMHRAARELLGHVSYRLFPDQRRRELAKLLSGPRPDPDFYQDMIDFTLSLDSTIEHVPYFGDLPESSPEYVRKVAAWYRQQHQKLASLRAETELADWVLTFNEPADVGNAHAISMWRKKHNALWLTAALAKVGPKDVAAPELLAAAGQVPATSPAYPTLAYHRARLLMAKEPDKARALVNSVLESNGLTLTFSSRNLFLAQRMQLAIDFEDFLSFISQPMVDVDYGDGYGPESGYMPKKAVDELLFGKSNAGEHRFDRQAAMLLNMRMPLELLQQASLSDKIPQRLRGELAAAAWTRAVMLGRHDIAEALVLAVESAYPGTAQWLKTYSAAQGTEEKWHAALFTILHFPGLRPYVNAGSARQTALEKIDNYRDNWWCVDVGAEVDDVNFAENDYGLREDSNSKFREPLDAPAYPSFLTALQAQSARNEWKELATSGTGPNYLTREVLRWARSSPKEPRIPEALSLAVRSTRFGCDNKDTTPLSHKAFALLHSQYPNSEWAKKTLYWF